MGGDLKNKATTAEAFDLECIENRRQVVTLELNVDNGTNDGLDMTDSSLCLSRV